MIRIKTYLRPWHLIRTLPRDKSVNTDSSTCGYEVAECKLPSAYPLVTEFDSGWSHNSRNHACAIKLSHFVIDSAINYWPVYVHQRITLLRVSDPIVVLTLKLIFRFIVGLTGIYVVFRHIDSTE
jgi:hypothetical protein